ncbi:hypothetical protein CYMTET_8073 [Cymbomonas tetramitiformis]|uniref:Uncharacterized protein n=1 Tax=Cymbomonas tetramitiformis TaxID=36881 RepID=A0AAE0GTZ4_9CHLO|nr:hypothetical protein CYMTET_8073 [Cymbomonas tetramitiformis]
MINSFITTSRLKSFQRGFRGRRAILMAAVLIVWAASLLAFAHLCRSNEVAGLGSELTLQQQLTTGYFHPGEEWLDTDGEPIQAHGGGILYVPETKTFYWYGENKNGMTYSPDHR